MQMFTPKQYLQIDIANNFGLDKEDWDTRLSWFQDQESQLESLVDKAEEPALYFAGVQAYRAVQRSEPIGYPISLDATSSGLQILAALTGDRTAAELCNVVNTGGRRDAYNAIYNWMLGVIGESSKINRKDTKRAIMTAFYTSTAIPKEVFGEGPLLRVFYDAMKANAPACWELNEAMPGLWNPDTSSHDWVLPDNFHVKVKVMNQEKEIVQFLNEPYETFKKVNQPTETGRSLGANTVHSIDGMIVREMTRRCDYDLAVKHRVWDALISKDHSIGTQEDDNMVNILWEHYKASGYLSARVLNHLFGSNIHLVDGTVILELLHSLPTKPFKIISIHDCFRCLPSYGNDLRKQYNQQLYEIGKSDLLSYIVSQLQGRHIPVNKMDPLMYKDILESDYSLS